MPDIVIFHRAVDDHIEAVLPTRDHQIVEDAAIFGEQQRIFLGEGFDAPDVGGDQRLERVVEPIARHEQLPHMADVEQRSEEHTSELQSLMRISYAVFCLKNKQKTNTNNNTQPSTTIIILIIH